VARTVRREGEAKNDDEDAEMTESDDEESLARDAKRLAEAQAKLHQRTIACINKKRKIFTERVEDAVGVRQTWLDNASRLQAILGDQPFDLATVGVGCPTNPDLYRPITDPTLEGVNQLRGRIILPQAEILKATEMIQTGTNLLKENINKLFHATHHHACSEDTYKNIVAKKRKAEESKADRYDDKLEETALLAEALRKQNKPKLKIIRC
jgi:hypothetical protein